MLVALATQCLTGLAKGLRGSFKNAANNVLSSVLEKFKEKKLNVVTALRECVDAIYPILGIENIQVINISVQSEHFKSDLSYVSTVRSSSRGTGFREG